jgi:hypothetical protein
MKAWEGKPGRESLEGKAWKVVRERNEILPKDPIYGFFPFFIYCSIINSITEKKSRKHQFFCASSSSMTGSFSNARRQTLVLPHLLACFSAFVRSFFTAFDCRLNEYAAIV